ncbi:MAG: hypothetical protein IJ744_10965 [Lachnospiraceae bacterium]|nr:hypothetical protein [Lachnospiraceae bacterium]
MKTLVIYYSQARGNTKRIADMIAAETGFDSVRIDTARPYAGTYDEIVDQGQAEVKRKLKPEFQPVGADLLAYERFIRKLGTAGINRSKHFAEPCYPVSQ